MLSWFREMKPFNNKLNINMMNFYKHEIVTHYKYFLWKTFGGIFVK
jgi:hypothetical protein